MQIGWWVFIAMFHATDVLSMLEVTLLESNDVFMLAQTREGPEFLEGQLDILRRITAYLSELSYYLLVSKFQTLNSLPE